MHSDVNDMNIPTLTKAGCQNRRQHLIDSVDVDVIAVTNPRNIHYYTGFLPEFTSLAEWGPAYVLIDGRNGKCTLIGHNFAAGAIRKAHVDQTEIWNWYNGSTDPGVEIYKSGVHKFREILASIDNVHSIAIEGGWFPFISGIESIDLQDITAEISYQQRCKYDDEIVCIRHAIEACLAGHQAARKEIRAGITELDLFSLINSAMTEKAGMPVKLISDILSGYRALEIGGGPTDKIIESGDTVILDLNPVVGGYRADYTATFVVDREPSDNMNVLESALHAAMEAGKRQLFPGRNASRIYGAVKACLDDEGFGKFFNHHAGHGLGLGHPEAPYFVPNSDEELMVGDVVTLEPGAYTKACAGRIEHVFLITENGPEQLTRHNTKFAL